MRPDAVQSIRGIQASLVEVIAAELDSAQAQDTLQTMVMLLESLAQEWDTAAHYLQEDNLVMSDILDRATAAPALKSFEAKFQPVVASTNASIKVSELRARNEQLRAGLQQLIITIEAALPESQAEGLLALRAQVYRHLRDVAVRGWSFWDALSFADSLERSRSRPG